MLIRKMALIASCAVAAGAFGASTASAATFVTDSVTNTSLASGTLVTNTTATPSVLSVSGLGTVTCTDTMAGLTVGASGGATVGGTLDQLTFQSCTDTIPLITISTCHVVTPLPTITITATGATGGNVALNNTYVRCNISGGTSGCYYFASTANGNAVNSTSSIAYSGVSVTHSVPTGGTGDAGSLCGSTGSFSSTLTHIVAPSLSNHTVTVHT